MRWRWLGDVLAVLVGVVALGWLALDAYVFTHGGTLALMDVQRTYRAPSVIFMGASIVILAPLLVWMVGDVVNNLARAPTRRVVVWLVVLMLLIPFGLLAYYLIEFRRRQPVPAEMPSAPTQVTLGDVLAVGSALLLMLFVVTLCSPVAFPESAPALLRHQWYLFAPLEWLPFEALWVWMLVDAAELVAHTRTRSAVTWLVALFLLNFATWYHYFAQYRPRRGGK